ncbi:hypothetical protein ACFE04_021628 [Oxalis oulophora]
MIISLKELYGEATNMYDHAYQGTYSYAHTNGLCELELKLQKHMRPWACLQLYILGKKPTTTWEIREDDEESTHILLLYKCEYKREESLADKEAFQEGENDAGASLDFTNYDSKDLDAFSIREMAISLSI